MNNLEHIIRNHKIFARSYVMMKEEIDRQCRLLGSNTEPELQLLFSVTSEGSPRASSVAHSAIQHTPHDA